MYQSIDRSEPFTDSQRDYLFQSANLLLEDRDYPLAQNLYSFLLKRNLRDWDALIGLGVCFLKLGQLAKGRKCFQACQMHLPLRDLALYFSGECARSEGNDELSLSFYRQIEKPESMGKFSFDYYKNRGNCHVRLEQCEEGFDCYQHALKIQGDSDAIYTNLGFLEMGRHELTLAKEHFERALELNPINLRAALGLGSILAFTQSYGDAGKWLRHVLDADPCIKAALTQLYGCARSDEDWVLLQEYISKFLAKQQDDADVLWMRATVLYREKKWKECERVVDGILSRTPNHSMSLELKQSLENWKPRRRI